MTFLSGSPGSSWQPAMPPMDTTDPSYWLNWRFFVCALWVLTTMVAGSFLIWKYEGFNRSRRENRRETQRGGSLLHDDDTWKVCLSGTHPAWLLAYRLVAFVALFSLLFANVLIDGVGIFYFYTQWTFTLVTIYFALGSILSIYGCRKYLNRFGEVTNTGLDTERGTYVAPSLGENPETSNLPKTSEPHEEYHPHQTAGVWSYIFQIIFQVCAGAVALTDSVFWLILYPFLTARDYKLNFLMVSMHSMNAFFLLGDTALNSLKFPLFRVSYFVLWTGIFVIFQWIIHAFVSMWWPYPFLDLSSPYAPLWYIGVGLMHIPCYGVFALIVRLKHAVLSRSFPESVQSLR